MHPLFSDRRFYLGVLAAALGALLFLGWRMFSRTREPAAPAPAATVPAIPPPAPSPADAANAAPPASPQASSPAAAASAEIQRTIRANAAAGRILFLDFSLDGAGLRLVGAVGAPGRAKPDGLRPGFGFVHYEVRDAAGRVTASGSVEDPTRRRVEFPASSEDGRIASKIVTSEGGPLAVRLPGESAPHRIILYRDRNPVAPAAGGREILGEFLLQPQP